MTTKIYRLYNDLYSPPIHYVSVLVDEKSAFYVFQNRIEKSTSPSGLMKRLLSNAKVKPEAPNDWLGLLMRSMTLTEFKTTESNGSIATLARQEQKILREIGPKRSGGTIRESVKQRELSDQIESLKIDSPDLADFLDPDGSVQEEPDSMRDFIRIILESQGTVALNPELKDWLDGGEPPEDFDGLVLYSETLSDEEKK